MKLSTKLIQRFILIVLVSIFLIGFISFNNAKTSLENTLFMELNVVAELKVEKITSFFDERESDIRVAQNYLNIRKNLPRVTQFIDNKDHPEYVEAKTELDFQLQTFPEVKESYIEVLLLNPKGEIVYTTENVHKKDELGTLFPAKDSFEQGKKQVYFSDIFPSPFFEGFEMLISAPVHDFDENFIGVIVFAIDMRPIYAFIQDNTGLGETGETVIGMFNLAGLVDPTNEASFKEDHVLFLNPLRHDPDAALEREIVIGDEIGIPIQEAAQGRQGQGISIDYRMEEVLAAWVPIPSLNWGLVSKIDTKEAFAPIAQLKFAIFVFGIVIALLASLYAFLFSVSITKPITRLKHATEKIRQGKLNTRIEVKLGDEFGELARDFNKMAQDLKSSQKQIKAHAESLEKEVYERTKDLESEKLETEKKAKRLANMKIATLNILEDVRESNKIAEKLNTELLDAQELTKLGSFEWDVVNDKMKGTPEVYIIFDSFPKDLQTYADYMKKVKKEDFKRVDEQIKKSISKAEQFNLEFRIQTKEGEKFVKIRGKVSGKLKGKAIRYIGTVQDITKEKMLDVAKTEFISSASHELKSPLVPIMGYLEMLNNEEFGKLSKEQKEKIEICYRNSINLKKLIEDMLDLSKLELNKIVLHKEKLDLSKLAKEIKENFATMAKENFIKIDVSAPDSVPVSVDRLRITQVISNLVKNALHYAGGTEKQIKPVTIQLSPGDTTVKVSITDEGPGIPKEEQGKLFDKFYRAKEAESSATGGSGLGLPISKALIRLHGGIMNVESEVGKGSTFSFTIPIGG